MQLNNVNSRDGQPVPLLTFWESKHETYPNLFKVVQYLSRIPTAQVTVERSFSTLSYVFSLRRSQLSEKLLESILIINLNRDLMQPIFQDEIKDIEEKHLNHIL